MPTKIEDLEGKIDHLRAQGAKIFEQAGETVDLSKVSSELLSGDTSSRVESIRARNEHLAMLATELKIEKQAEHEALQAELDAKEDVDRGGRAAAYRGGEGRDARVMLPPKSIGEMFVESDAYSGRPKGQGYGPQSVLETGPSLQATLFQRTAGWAPESLRTGTVVPFATRPIQVTDLFSQAETTSAAVVYMEETTFTNNAAERAEAGAYVESALALTQRTVNVQTVGTSLPITDEQLADVAQARTYVDGRVGFFVQQRLDSQLINGDGNTPNIVGILNVSGLQTQAKGTDPAPDAIFKAAQKVRVTGRAFPSASVIHPDNWTTVRLLRTADGIYIWGSPSEPGPDTIWGLQVVQSDVIASGTGLVGDFSPAMVQLFVRQGLDVQVGYVNDDFKKGQQTIRAGVRVANVIYRGSAFCTVTSLT